MSSDTTCLKEWNAVVESLGQGKQSILIRKYSTSQEGFFLFPTFSYTKPDNYLKSFKQEYWDFIEKNKLPTKVDAKREIKYYAKVEEVVKKPSNEMNKFNKFHIWTKNHLNSYLKQRPGYVWILRVFKLESPFMAELNPNAIIYAYLDKNMSLENSNPVLSDSEYRKIIEHIK